MARHTYIETYFVKVCKWTAYLCIKRVQYDNYINPGYGLSLVDTLWNASSYRQPLEQEGDPMT